MGPVPPDHPWPAKCGLHWNSGGEVPLAHNNKPWFDPVNDAQDKDENCYKVRADAVYGHWKNWDTANKAFEITTWSKDKNLASAIAATTKTDNDPVTVYMNDVASVTGDLYSAAFDVVNGTLDPAYTAMHDSVNQMTGNTSQIYGSFLKGVTSNSGSFTTAQFLYALAKNVTKLTPVFSANVSRILDHVAEVIESDVDIINSEMTPFIDELTTNSSEQWGHLYTDMMANLKDLGQRFNKLNNTLQGEMLALAKEQLDNVTSVYNDERSLNTSSLNSINTLLPAVMMISKNLHATVEGRTYDMLKMAPANASDEAASLLTRLLENQTDSLGSIRERSVPQFTSSIAPILDAFDTRTRLLLGKFNTTAGVPTVQAKMDNLLTIANAALVASNSSLVDTMNPVYSGIGGRDFQLNASTKTASTIFDYVSSFGGSTDMQMKASELEAAMDNSELLQQATSGTGSITDEMFENMQTQLSDIFNQRDALMESAQADVASMQSAVAELAASLGMSMEGFMNQMIEAQTALTEMDSSTGQGISASGAAAKQQAASTASAAAAKLQDQAVKTTMAAVNSRQSISEITSSMQESNSKLALAASEQAGALMGAASEASESLASSAASLMSKVGSNATAQANSMTALANVLEGSKAAAAALTSQIRLTGSGGSSQISASGSAISKAFSAALKLVQSYMNEEAQSLKDDSDSAAAKYNTALTDLIPGLNISLLSLQSDINAALIALQPIQQSLGLPNVEQTVQQIGKEIGQVRARSDDTVSQQVSSEAANALLANTSLSESRSAESSKITDLSSRAFSEIASIAKSVADGSEKLLSPLREMKGGISDSLVNANASRVTQISKYLGLNSTAETLKSDAQHVKQDLLVYSSRVRSVALGSTTNFTQWYRGMNDSLSHGVETLHGNLTGEYKQVIKKVNEIKVNSSEFTQLSDLAAIIQSLSDPVKITVPRELSYVASAVADVVNTLNSSSFTLDDYVRTFLANQTDTANDQVLLPFFGLLNETRIFAREAAGNLSSIALASHVLTAEAAGSMSSMWSTAQAAKASAAAAVAQSQADAANEAASADFAIKANSQLAASAAKASALVVDRFGSQVKLAQWQNELSAENATLTVALMNATWASLTANASQAMAISHANMTSSLTSLSSYLNSQLAGKVMHDIMKMWSDIEPDQQAMLARVPRDANSQIITLQAAAKSAATSSSAQIQNTLTKVESMISQLSNLERAASMTKLLPQTISGQLHSARSSLADLQMKDIDEFSRSVASLIQQRRAQAADNILSLYQSLSSMVSNTRGVAVNLQQYQTI